jgi:hypothetical protein
MTTFWAQAQDPLTNAKTILIRNVILIDQTGKVYSRWSSIDLTDQNIYGGEMNTFSLGMNWWPFSIIQLNINYRYSILYRFGEKSSNHGLVTRLAFVLE